MGCSTNRYLLINDIDNTDFLIDLIKDYSKQGLVGRKPIIVLDGIPHRYNYELKDSSFSFVKNDVETVEILKEEAANRIYGRFAKDGVILITTKTKSIKKDTKEDLHKKNILFIADGIKLKGFDDTKDINPNEIASIEVIKQPEIFGLYSDDPTLEGIVIIRTNQYLVKLYRERFSTYSTTYKLLADTIPIENDHDIFTYWVDDTTMLKDNIYNKLDSISNLDIKEIQVIPILNEIKKVDVNIKINSE